MINVTSFFRDSAVFDLLEREVIPDLIENLAANQAMRMWVVGCSTGEEAYSLAMIFREAIMASGRDIKLQVFASDLDAQAITVAREGLYSLSIKDEIPADRLARYFVLEEGGYRVTPGLRGSVVFTVQDVINDPPFSRMDLVSCRNLLIYLKPGAQAKVIGLFHFALRENGILMLGMAETPGNVVDRFAMLHKAERIYRHIAKSKPGEPGFPLSFVESIPRLNAIESKQQITRQAVLTNLCRDTVLESFAPASLLINAQRQCIYSIGPVSRYLQVASGPPTLDVLAMVPAELRGTLRYAITRADRDRPLINTHLCETRVDGAAVYFTITVRFLESEGEDLHLVSFIEETAATTGMRSADTLRHTHLICVVEDKPDISNAMRSVLEHEDWSVTDYPSAEAFLAEETTSNDQCLIVDTNLPGMSGIALIEHLRAKGDTVPAILITGTGDISMAVQAMRSGASDFIERPISRRELIDSIERAVMREPAGRPLDAAPNELVERLAALTPRQKAVLDMVMAGEPSKNIAADLGISQHTVESHRGQIMQKLGLRTIPNLVQAVLSVTPA